MPADIESLRTQVAKIESKDVTTQELISDLQATKQESGKTAQEVKEEIQKKIRWKAMDLLYRREHSQKELLVKLQQRFEDEELYIGICVRNLAEEGLQSDDRFCESYVAMRKRKGYGPQRIFSELKEKGVDEGLINNQLNHQSYDWFAHAQDVWRKKFKGRSPIDLKEKSKQMRFMHYRGFNQDQIQSVFTDPTGF